MTDREKLIALMRQVDACICNLCDGGEEPFNHSAEILADHFLANGVVVREKGEWVDHCVRDWRCSKCGEKIKKVRNVDGYCYDDKPNFCPNCGADMRKGKNG